MGHLPAYMNWEEGEKREKGGRGTFKERMAENFPCFKNYIFRILSEVQIVCILRDRQKSHHRKKLKVKERILKAAREKLRIMYKGTTIRLTTESK